MPVLLTTPWNPGDRDPGHTYPRAQITYLAITPEGANRSIVVSFEYGDMVNAVWVRGAGTTAVEYRISEGDYDAMIAEEIEEGDNDLIYKGAKRAVYEWLIAEGFLAGTIE